MQKTIEVLKKHSVIETLQEHFDSCPPHKGTSEEQIENTINFIITHESFKNEKLADEFTEALLGDAAQHIRKELNIQFCEESEFHKIAHDTIGSLLHQIIDTVFGKEDK